MRCSAHFSYKQVKIFTCVACQTGTTKFIALISDSLSYSKIDVMVFLTQIIGEMAKEFENFKNIFLMGEVANLKTQLKHLLPYFINLFRAEPIEWNYVATSYSKGAVDGIGATIKRKFGNAQKTKILYCPMRFHFTNAPESAYMECI